MCQANSFAASQRAKNWHTTKNGNTTPRDIFIRTGDMYWFMCDAGHTFQTSPDKVFHSWCPTCKNKTEQEVFDFLVSMGLPCTSQPKFDWCRRRRFLPFDIAVGTYIIEVDGDQHFKDMACWKSKSDDVQTRDGFKAQQALENGYSVIRLYQMDVYKKTIDWQTELLSILYTPATEYTQMYYIAKDPAIYNAHKKLVI